MILQVLISQVLICACVAVLIVDSLGLRLLGTEDNCHRVRNKSVWEFGWSRGINFSRSLGLEDMRG